MIDILLWVLFLIVAEGGAVLLMVWMWKLYDKLVDTEPKGTLCFVGFVIAMIFVVALGIMLASSAVLGTVKLFGMYA